MNIQIKDGLILLPDFDDWDNPSIALYSVNTGIPINELIFPGYWLNPKLAVHIMMMLDDTFNSIMCYWVSELIWSGDLEMNIPDDEFSTALYLIQDGDTIILKAAQNRSAPINYVHKVETTNPIRLKNAFKKHIKCKGNIVLHNDIGYIVDTLDSLTYL